MKKKILITGGSGFIGTNIIDLFIDKGYDFINFDKAPPLKKSHTSFWHKGNILNLEELDVFFDEYEPTIVIHLAAKTDTIGLSIDYYIENTKGTDNLLSIIQKKSIVERVVITSTQYVFFPKSYNFPKSDTDYNTHTIYGDSKVITEELTRSSNLNCAWTIIRPTNVWGPWHIRYSNELLKYIKSGIYVHPGFNEVKKSYAYVKSVTHQIESIINADISIIDRATFYVGDYPKDSYEWANEFSIQMRNTKIHRIPKIILKLLAIFGDFFKLVGINFPLDSKRYNNMITQYLAPMKKTIDLFGTNPESFEENIKETIDWLKNEGSSFSSTKYN